MSKHGHNHLLNDERLTSAAYNSMKYVKGLNPEFNMNVQNYSYYRLMKFDI